MAAINDLYLKPVLHKLYKRADSLRLIKAQPYTIVCSFPFPMASPNGAVRHLSLRNEIIKHNARCHGQQLAALGSNAHQQLEALNDAEVLVRRIQQKVPIGAPVKVPAEYPEAHSSRVELDCHKTLPLDRQGCEISLHRFWCLRLFERTDTMVVMGKGTLFAVTSCLHENILFFGTSRTHGSTLA